MPPRSAKRKATKKSKQPQPDNLTLHEIIPINQSEIELPPPLEQTPHIKLEVAQLQVQESGLLPPQPVVVVEADDCASVAVESSSIGVIEGVGGSKDEPVVADTVMGDGAIEGVVEAVGGAKVEPIGAKEAVTAAADTLVEDGASANPPQKEGLVKGSVEENNDDNSIPKVDSINEETKALTTEMNSAEVEIAAAQTTCGSNNILVAEEDHIGEGQGEESDGDDANSEDSDEDNEGNGDYEESSFFGDISLTGSKKDKNFEIYIGRLDKETVEDDLIKIFGKFGELKSARIVRNPTTKKSKGFAFVQFTSTDHAKNALAELKDGVEVKGKHVKISASQENDTIYVGNICKTWSKEDVLGKLKEYGIGDFEEIHLPDDPKNDGKIKGFTLLEFSTHSDAMAAFNRLRKPDAIFGRDKSAKVAFTQSPMHPSEEVLSQVKRVYFEGLTKAWNEEKLKEICSQYGEIVKINLCHSGNKQKDFGFITFTSREAALACVEGINRAHIREGEVEVKASMAKPQHKGRLQKQGFRGGFKVEKQSQVTPSKKESGTGKQAETSKANGHANSKKSKGKGKTLGEQKEKTISTSSNVEQSVARKTQDSTGGRKIGTTSKSEKNLKRKKPTNVDDRRVGGTEHMRSKRPLKKARGNERGKERNNTRNRNRDPRIRQGQNYSAESTKHRNPYATSYAIAPAYQVGNAHAASGPVLRRHYTDMEPHARYLEPVAVREVPLHSGYIELGSETQLQPHAGYLEPSAGRQGQVRTRYIEHTMWAQSSSGHIQNAVRTHIGPHAGYLQPAAEQRGQDSYSPGLIRASGYDGQRSSGYGYGRVGLPIPAPYIPTHARYAGGQDGGYSYQNIGAHPPPRTHY